MREYTNDELLERFPGGIAEIVPVTDTVRSRLLEGLPTKERARARFIALKIPVEKGLNPLTGNMMYDETTYNIGPLEPGNTIRTDNLGRCSKDHASRPLLVLRALLAHDGHRDADGNILSFDLAPVEQELLKIEEQAKKDKQVQKSLRDLKGKGYQAAKPAVHGTRETTLEDAPPVPALAGDDDEGFESV